MTKSMTEKKPKGQLYLLPVPLGEQAYLQTISAETRAIASGLAYFVVEQAKTARQILKNIQTTLPLQSLSLSELNEHTPAADLRALLQPLLDGHDVGLMSEAGCPAIADPGANLVKLAHQHGIRVIPQVGPSSILLGLMASGCNGQSFVFHGYLPVDSASRTLKIRALEQASQQNAGQTQLFIEAPYRNKAMLTAILTSASAQTWLCTATDLSLMSEEIHACTIQDWRKRHLPDLHKRPTMFILQA